MNYILTFSKQALDGFVFVVGKDKRLLFISEAASTQLGLSQVNSTPQTTLGCFTLGFSVLKVEMVGNSILDYIQPEDQKEFLRMFDDVDSRGGDSRQLILRVKCVLAKRNAGLTSNGYKVTTLI